ncbi:DNA adenine methylase [Clostridium hydrogeniformans]|uniref:DNA adenine methylase n=1 Tax=Clostridium hydrogeniformans TaxID=349933 RepID=UPI0004814D31|nr:Dam family site-specific DNA-(adenine-N6)-methyltransferase [Clostridium hydrogeniformans]
MMNPPISRMGGKSKLRKNIIKMIPGDHICYVEVFLGAGWVYFGKEPSKVEVINDTDQELINLFKMLKYHGEEVERLLSYEVVSRDNFYDYRDQDFSKLTEVQRAVRFMYLSAQSFASRGISFGYSALGKPSPKLFKTNCLIEIKKRLSNTYIENLDCFKIIEKYDRSTTFFFCDPPYIETEGYKDKFGTEEHIRLYESLKSIKGKFLITLNDNEFVRDLYREFSIEEVDVTYSVSRDKAARKSYGELIIKNY